MTLVLQVHIRGHIFYIVLFGKNLQSIFLSETNMPYSLGIRFAKSLSGSLLGMVTLLKVLLSFISCGFLRVQWVSRHCVVVA